MDELKSPNKKVIVFLAAILLSYLYFLRLVSFSYLSIEPYPITASESAFPGEKYFKWDGQAWGVIPNLSVKVITRTDRLWFKKIYMAVTALFISLVPLIIFWAALNFEMSENEALTAAFLAAVYWLFDPVLHNSWFWGQAAWPGACVLAVWTLSYFYRLKTDTSVKFICFGLVVLSISSHLLVTVFLFPVWLVIGYSSPGSDITAKKVFVSVVIILLILFTIFLQLPEELKKTVLFMKITLWDGVKEIIRDHKPLLPIPLGTQAFKMLIGLFGFYGIFKWKQDRKYPPFLYGAMILLCLTYFGGVTGWLDFLSPYRFGIPLFFLLVFPAAWTSVYYFRLFKEQDKIARLAGVSVLLLLVPSFFTGVSYSLSYPRIAAAAALKSYSYQPHWEKALKYENQKEEAKAVAEYKLALKARPNDPQARFRLARIYLKHWNLRKARRLLLEVVELKPDYHEAYGVLGILYLRGRDRKSAQRMFGKVLEIKPDDPAAKQYLHYLKEGGNPWEKLGG